MIRNRDNPRRGLSLLEVVLALAILAMAAAYLSQSMHLAAHNATRAQELTQAELIAESVMNQIIGGVLSNQPVGWTPYVDIEGQSEWVYQVQNVPCELEGMIGLQVAVQKLDPQAGLVETDVDLFVNRWIIDPTLGLDVPPTETEEGMESSSDGSGSSTGGTSGGSAGSTSGGSPSGSATGGGAATGGGGFGFGGGFSGGGGGAGGRGGGPQGPGGR